LATPQQPPNGAESQFDVRQVSNSRHSKNRAPIARRKFRKKSPNESPRLPLRFGLFAGKSFQKTPCSSEHE